MNDAAACLADKLGWNSRACGRIRNIGYVGINKTPAPQLLHRRLGEAQTLTQKNIPSSESGR
jgi:hypothetical protein